MKVKIKVNRSPVMLAWSLVVCLRMGFELEEALSLGKQLTLPYRFRSASATCSFVLLILRSILGASLSCCLYRDERNGESHLPRPRISPDRPHSGRRPSSYRQQAAFR
jgi:hypothetical protein